MNLAQIMRQMIINMNSYPHNVRERTTSKFFEIGISMFHFSLQETSDFGNKCPKRMRSNNVIKFEVKTP